MDAKPPSPERRAGGRDSFASGISFNAFSFLSVAVLGLASGVITARIYGIHVIGQFALVSAPVEALWFLSSIKEQAALVRELTSLPPRAPRITGLFAAVTAFSTALTLVVASVAGIISTVLFHGALHRPDLIAPTLVSLAAYTFITNMGWNLDAVFSAFVSGRTLFWIRLHQAVMFIVLGVAIGLLAQSVWGLVAASYGSALTALIHRLVSVRRIMRLSATRVVIRDGFRTLPALLRFGVKIAPGTIFQGISNQAATWTLGITSTVASVGAFNRAQVLTRRLDQFNMRLAEMLFPTLVARHAANDQTGFDRAFVDTVRYALLFLLLVAAVCGGAADGIMSLFGPGFERAAGAFGLLLLMPPLTTLSTLQMHALVAVGRPGITSFTATGRMVTTVALTIVLTGPLGLIGPALALVAGGLVDVSWKAAVLKAYLGTPALTLWRPRELVALLAACATSFAVARALDSALGHPGALPFTCLIAGMVYGVALRSLGGLNERDRERGRQIVARLPPRAGRLAAVVLGVR